MASVTFYHGSKARLYYNGHDVSTNMRSVRGGTTVDNADISGLSMDTKQYIPGLQDATLGSEGIYDGSASRIDDIVNDALTASIPSVFSWVINNDLIGRTCWGMEADESNYEVKAGMGDAATFTLDAKPNSTCTPYGGWERGLILWAGSSINASTAGTAQNYAGCSAYGGFAYLHLISMSGSARIALQHSTDNVTFTDVLTSSYASTASGQGFRFTASGSVYSYVRAAASPDIPGSGSVKYHLMFGRRFW